MTRPAALRGLHWWATVGLDAKGFAPHLSADGERLASEAESTVHPDGVRALKSLTSQ